MNAHNPKSAFLTRLPEGEATQPPPTPVAQYVSDRKGTQAFIAAWGALGGTSQIASAAEAAVAVKTYSRGRGDILASPGAVEGLVPDLTWPDCGRQAAAAAGVGVVRAEAAAQATGSVIIRSDTNLGRSVSLLPPACVFVIDESTIMESLGAYLRRLSALPSQLVAVTGPSRSADIESTLVIGVHGPGEVHALIIR